MADWKNKLFIADNLRILREYVSAESVDLAYSFTSIHRICTVIIVTLTLLAVAGCESNRLEKQNQQILSQLNQQEKIQDFYLQTKCSQAAKRFFDERRDEYLHGPTLGLPVNEILLTLAYTDHYNKSLNKCLIRLEHNLTVPTRGMAYAVEVDDVNERVAIAHFFGVTSQPNIPPTTCSVHDDPCTSADDFEAKLTPLMIN